MNAIVFVVMPASDSQRLAEQVNDLLPTGGGSDRTKASLSTNSEPDQSTPPFWTWFIENPRPVGQHTATA
jgi:hypothetical protein